MTNIQQGKAACPNSTDKAATIPDAGYRATSPMKNTLVIGRVETLSTEFILGWASVSSDGNCSYVYARLDEVAIGFGVANITRPDLSKARQEGRLDAYGFIIVFDNPIPANMVQSVEVLVVGQQTTLSRTKEVKLDRTPPLRLFLMGSPRSGTSELGSTLTKTLRLPWVGEGHAAPLFSVAANALSGDAKSKNGLVRLLSEQNFRRIAIEAAKKAYFCIHASASFLDKTPGISMITAAPFLNECFPDCRFIFQRRNPVGNVLSRMVKFGGNFEAHCRDWAATMNEWIKIRAALPHYVEVQQEDMLEAPDQVASTIADYVGMPDSAAAISKSLRAGSLEQTGAGAGKTHCSQTEWTAEQIKTFESICGPTMRIFGYS